jgi:hypothetical protein
MNKYDFKNIINILISSAENLCDTLELGGAYSEYATAIEDMRSSIASAKASINNSDETF